MRGLTCCHNEKEKEVFGLVGFFLSYVLSWSIELETYRLVIRSVLAFAVCEFLFLLSKAEDNNNNKKEPLYAPCRVSTVFPR